MKLIIIGSGIAGLASAVRLQAMGFEVTVLEPMIIMVEN